MSESKNKTPKQAEMAFEPAYEDIGGIKHEYTGLLWTPAPGEAAKIRERQEAERPTPDLTGFSESVTTVIAPFPQQWATKRVKMSGMDMLRLRARGQ